MLQKRMKRTVSVLLAMVLLLFLVGCSATNSASGGLFTPGTYTGTGKGNNGDIKVEVTFDADKITKITVLEHGETEGLAEPALENMPQEIIDQQSTQVDTVAGATNTSKGIIEAVNDAIQQAGADPAALLPKNNSGVVAQEIVKDIDVVVVGGGLAGLSAAIKATEGGAKVILMEKMAVTGGSSALSGGGLGATNSAIQQEYDIKDSNEAWRQLWEERQATSPEIGQYPDWDRVDSLIAYSAESIDWFTSLGYEFRKPEGFGVDPVERLHFPSPEGNGAVLTQYLTQYAEEKGVEILLETHATKLIEKDGAVVGILAASKQADLTINAKAVILASGGFANSEELVARFVPEVKDYMAYGVSAAGNTGDGIVMAEEVGAAVYEDPWLIGLGLATPVSEMRSFYWYGTYIMVNGQGERFTNEAGHYSIVYNDAVYKSPEGSFMVFDSGEAFAAFSEAAETAIDNEAVYKGETLEELAVAMGVNAENLALTVKDYNAISTGTADAFGKNAAVSIPLTKGPFYAVEYYPSNMGTMGGVKITENAEVVTTSDEVIPGLYAAGEMANRAYYSQVYMSGSALQVAATTGQIAGEKAAAFALGK
ncbi:MAG: FAD-dependent oxidoreductase [Oscillospiraceae bacterium]